MMNWNSNVKIDIHNENGSLVDTTQFHNIITDDGMWWMARAIGSSYYEPKIIYCGWGLTNTAPSTTQTKLIAESGRKIITSYSVTSSAGCVTVCYLSPTDAIVNIQELGWFVGSSANASSDTGCMISRTLYSRNKTNLESITIIRTDTFVNTT